MVPADEDRGYRHTSFVPNARTSHPSDASSSLDEMTRSELENLTPYERWLVTLPDDSPELTSFSDPRVGPAPIDPPRYLISGADGTGDALTGTAGDDRLGLPPIPPRKPIQLDPPSPPTDAAQIARLWLGDQASSVIPLSQKSEPPTGMTRRDMDLVTRTVLGEARGEGELGMRGVAYSIRNRWEAADPIYGLTWEEIVLKPKQFDANRKGTSNYENVAKLGPGHPEYEAAYKIVRDVITGRVQDPTGGAVSFRPLRKNPLTGAVPPIPRSMGDVEITRWIGDHAFMREREQDDPPIFYPYGYPGFRPGVIE